MEELKTAPQKREAVCVHCGSGNQLIVISTNRKSRSCGENTEAARRKMLRRILNAPFMPPDDLEQILSKLIRAEIRARSRAEDWSATQIPAFLDLKRNIASQHRGLSQR